MQQPDTFCDHTMQQNVTAAGAPQSAPDSVGEANSAPMPLSWFKGGRLAEGMGRERRGKEREERGRDGKGGGGSWKRATHWLRPALDTHVGTDAACN